MIRIDENSKSEAQIRLMEKLERDKKRLQEQVKKDHRKIEELKKKARGCIGDMFAEHLPDFYCFDGEELKEIIDTAMTQKVVRDKISEISERPDEADISAEEDNKMDSSDGETLSSDIEDNAYGSVNDEDVESGEEDDADRDEE